MSHAIDEDPMDPLQNDPLILGKAWWGPVVGPIKTPCTEKSENYCLWLRAGLVYVLRDVVNFQLNKMVSLQHGRNISTCS